MTASVATPRRDAARTPAPATTPRLRLARPKPTPAVRRARITLRPLALSAGLVVAALLAVVVGNMMLASGQLRLEQLQQRLAQVESTMSASQELYQQKTSPQYVAQSAERHHLAPPVATYTLPSVVDLSRRLPPPRFSDSPCCSITPRR